MEKETIILIITNIVVPIVVAIITGSLQAKKYKKEIELLNVTHENRIKELTSDYIHKIENTAEPRKAGIAKKIFDAGILWVKHGRARAIQKLTENWPKTAHFLSCVSIISLL